jgi:hypothetical protein
LLHRRRRVFGTRLVQIEFLGVHYFTFKNRRLKKTRGDALYSLTLLRRPEYAFDRMREAVAWLSSHATLVQAVAAIVQAATAIVIVWFTGRLTKATSDYAKSTKDMLDLDRAQESRARLANWHFSFAAPDNGVACLKIINLSTNSARITHLLTRVASENETASRTFPLDLGMASNQEKATGDVAHDILQAVDQYFSQGGDWDGFVEIGILFQLAEDEAPRPSAKFLFRVVVRGRRLTEITARMPYVAVVAPQGEPQ